ncbi:MAG: hypothetical protein ACHQ53_08320 [Polyangiales bacterium]
MQKALKALLVATVLGCALNACSYGGVATAGDAAIIARNDNILFGLLRKVYVCKVTPAGLSQCGSAEAP